LGQEERPGEATERGSSLLPEEEEEEEEEAFTFFLFFPPVSLTRLSFSSNLLSVAPPTRQSCPSHRIKPNQNSQQLDNSHLIWTALNTTGIMQLRQEMITFLRRMEKEGKMGPKAWGEGKVRRRGGFPPRPRGGFACLLTRWWDFRRSFEQGLVFTAGNAVSSHS
jgi:hypothetical protein